MYRILQEEGIDLPRYAVLNRDPDKPDGQPVRQESTVVFLAVSSRFTVTTPCESIITLPAGPSEFIHGPKCHGFVLLFSELVQYN